MDYRKQRKISFYVAFLCRVLTLIGCACLLWPITMYAYINEPLYNILMGICCSIIAWALVEIWLFNTNMFSEYLQERYAFVNEIQKTLLNIKNKFEDLEEDIQEDSIDGFNDALSNRIDGDCINRQLIKLWDDIEKELNIILSFANRFPLNSKYYCLTEEYKEIGKVLNNCFWILTSCLYTEYGGSPHLTEAYRKLISYILRVETITIDQMVSDMDRDFNGTEKEYARIRQFDIDNDWIIPSEEVCWREDCSMIKRHNCVRVNIGQKCIKELIFKPAQKLKPILEKDMKCGLFSTFAYPFRLFFYLVKNDFSNINV